MQQKKQRKTGPWIAGIITALLAGLIYWLIFPLEKAQHFAICGCVSLGLGWLIFVMAQGVDTSKRAPAQRSIRKTGNAVADDMIMQGLDLLRQIRREASSIKDAYLRLRTEEFHEVATLVLDTVAEEPALALRIRRFMAYYLPTTLKMLQSFRKMEERGVDSPQAQAAMAQIQKAMGTVIDALENQLNNLYQDDILDISTDIDVLEAMLHQDGLTDSGMDQN